MKKWTVVMLVLTLFAFSGSSVFAHDRGSNDDKYDQQKQSCNQTAYLLNQVLLKTKNEKSRALLTSLIASFKAQCATDSSANSQNTQKVTDDKNALAIQFLLQDNANNVTLPVILPLRGKNGSSITWTSSNPLVLSNDGLNLKRQPQADVAVDLTAVLKFNNATATKTFRVIVKGTYPQLTDAQRVAKDKDALAIEFGGSDNGGSVTQPFKSLPAKGANGSKVTWTSMSPSIISSDGKTVNRPANGNGDLNVVLTALIQSGGATEFKIFTVTVKQQLPAPQRVAADKAALQIDFGGSDSSGRVTRPLDGLPSRGVNGSSITWVSSSPGVLSSDGKTLHRPASNNADIAVYMTAIIISGTSSDTKIFNLTVKREFNSPEKVAADKTDLGIAYKSGDSSASVTQSVGLPTKGYYGSTIVWYSGNASVLSNSGAVHRPAHGQGDVKVTLTAVISNSGSADVRSFTVTVKQQ
ncbi:hypothetical protein GZH47_30430 [Paenibacillus rhizovicinus]|uniref:Atrophied bacterial Ig domain-containing protein n=1 Tax=Paenibacillus rhizovicinus TaxID=2704463 RepID=A0A6C0P896_9BACL|nr:immunoglobulin-like domain-containing protein [Paenibacillus rhizovicinus]QHW34689.1 hypothetical protein GZH47_30430 [Paenibacillus rhizovicinus]